MTGQSPSSGELPSLVLTPNPKQFKASGRALRLPRTLALTCRGVASDSPGVRDLSAALRASHGVVPLPASQALPTVILEVKQLPGLPKREAYRLSITPQELRITGSDAAGVYFGAQTLCQILRQCPAPRQVPTLEITDWPDFPIRTAHLTLFRYENQRPSLPFWEGLIERVAAAGKLNTLIIQVDWMMAYRSRPELGQATAFLPEELAWLCALGKSRHIAMVPHLQCLSHQYFLVRKGHPDWLIHPESETYRPEAPGLRATLRDAMAELYTVFGRLPEGSPVGTGSPPIHLGFDEVGSLPTRAGLSESDIYLRHLQELASDARKIGFSQVGIWPDMLARYEPATQGRKLLGRLPKGTLLFPWDYKVRNDFSTLLQPLVGQGFPIWPTGSAKYQRDNLGKLARHARRLGADALVGSCWNSWAPMLVDTVARPLSGLLLAGEFGWSADADKPLNAPLRSLAYDPMARVRELLTGLSPIDPG